MESKLVKCPYNNIKFNNVPGYDRNIKKCPYCGSDEIGVDEKGNTVFVHNEINRTFLTKDEAINIFKKYIKAHYTTYGGGKDILDTAWYSQHWPTYRNNSQHYNPHPKQNWMGIDLLLAFDWYLDAVGRDLGLGYGRAEGLISKKEIDEIERNLTQYGNELLRKKRESQRISKERAENKAQTRGEEIVKSLNIGDVVLVKFKGYWRNKGMQILEIEDDFIAGFYLDRVQEEVNVHDQEINGFIYKNSRNCWDANLEHYIPWKKFKWDGKTFKKTRTYESKMIKFIIKKIENPIILK